MTYLSWTGRNERMVRLTCTFTSNMLKQQEPPLAGMIQSHSRWEFISFEEPAISLRGANREMRKPLKGKLRNTLSTPAHQQHHDAFDTSQNNGSQTKNKSGGKLIKTDTILVEQRMPAKQKKCTHFLSSHCDHEKGEGPRGDHAANIKNAAVEERGKWRVISPHRAPSASGWVYRDFLSVGDKKCEKVCEGKKRKILEVIYE